MKTTIINKILLVLMLITAQQVSALEFQVDGIYYRTSIFTKNSAYVTHSGTSYTESVEYQGEVVIPESVTYNGKTYTIASIGGYAFAGCPGLTSVTIPSTVTTINQNAFNGCTGLKTIECKATTPPALGDNAFTSYDATLVVPSSSESVYKSAAGWSNFKFKEESSETPGSGNTGGGSGNDNGDDTGGSAVPEVCYLVGNYNGWSVPNIENVDDLYTLTDPDKDGVYYGKFYFNKDEFEFKIFLGIGDWSNGDLILGIEDNTSISMNNISETFTLHDSNSSNIACLGWIGGYVEIFFDFNNKTLRFTIPNENNTLVYKITSSTDVEVIAGADKYKGDIVIPSQVTISGKTYTVTSIANDAFKGCTGLTSITIPSSITSIGSSSFDSCTNLNKVSISDMLSWCKITFGNSLANPLYYAKNLYLNGSLVSKLEIPSAITEIKNYTFYNCTSISTIVFPSGILKIGNSAFVNCSNMTSVTIPNSVTTIDENAFNGCTGLASLTIGSSVGSIGNYAFGNCTGLKSVTSLNSTPPTCGTGVFQGVTISSIPLTVPAGSESLYKATYTWQDFKYKEESENPGDDPAVDTSGLKYNIISSTDVEVIGGTEKYTGDIVIPSQTTIDGKTYNVTKISDYAFHQCSSLTRVSITNSVTVIGNFAFYGCTSLTNVSIPNSVTNIGEYAFRDCIGLTSIEIPNSVTSIADETFCNCKNLTSIEIPNSVTSIGNNAFLWCSSLTSISIPYSVTSIGSHALGGCSSLVSIVVESGNNKYDSRINCNAIIETASNTLIAGCMNSIIPNSVIVIGDGAFGYCSYLTSIEIPNSVISIDNNAFYDCSGLTRVTSLSTTPPTCGTDVFYNVSVGNITLEVPAESVSMYQSADTWKDFGTIKGISESSTLTYKILNETDVEVVAGTEKYTGDIVIPSQTTIDGKTYSVTSIGNSAFYRCSGLTSVIIPNSATSIGSDAFRECIGLTSVTIPNSITSIGSGAFYYCSGLTSVTIPNSVTIIGPSAFSHCSGLPSVTIPNSVTSIGDGAFDGCSGLTSVIFNAENCETMGSSSSPVFENCTSLSSVTIGENVKNIPSYAFSDCIGLTSITIPNSVTSISGAAFSGCRNLTSITIPNSVTSIGYAAFSGCTSLKVLKIDDGESILSLGCNVHSRTDLGEGLFNDCPVETLYLGRNLTYTSTRYYGYSPFYNQTTLKSVTIGNNVTSIDVYTFFGCNGLTSIIIPNSVISIGEYAFYGCSGLTSVTIGNSATSIGNYAFSGCSGLTSITIPSSVTSIADFAFGDCNGLTSVISLNLIPPTCETNVFNNVSVGNITLEVPAESVSMYLSADIWKDFGTIKGIGESSALTYNILNETDVEVIGGTEKYTGDIVIPSQTKIDGKVYNVTKVGDKAFLACRLTSITIPNSVTSIGNEAFLNSRLTSITIPNSVTSIEDRAFSGCSGLTSVTIGNSVTSIGKYAFHVCTGLTSVTIPNSVTSIGDDAFFLCSGLKSIIVESGNTVYDSRDNCNAIIETSTNILITGCKNTVIPNSVTGIGPSAFNGCSGLTSITIGNGVSSIGISAFSGCSDLESIIVESGNIVYDSRDNCNAIIETSTNILITGCKNTVIPNSVTGIGPSAFSYCSGLTSVTIGNSVTNIGNYAFSDCIGLTSITIPNSVTSIGDGAFSGCSGLTSIIIPSSVTGIGDFAFYLCSGLTSITIPNSVTSIGNYAFSGCSGLTSITIPNSITSIGNYAFSSCSGLTSVTSLNPTPPTCGSSVFYNVSVGNITLEVPAESVSMYQSADTWKDFGTIETYISYPVGLSKMWAIPFDPSTGYCSVRTVNGFGDVIYGANNTAGTIEEWKDGVLVTSYDVNKFCADNNLGETVKVIDSGTGTETEKFQSYLLWTAVMVDDAGNILANVGIGAGSAATCQNWVLLPASDRNAMQLLHIDEFPSADVTLGRVDVPSRIVGNITDGGAYLYIPATNSVLMPVMYIALDGDGKIYYDAENSWILMSSLTFDASTNVATFQTADEILGAADEAAVAAKTYVRWRGRGAPFTWNAETSQLEQNTSFVPGVVGTPGMDVFKIGEIEYIVLPVKSATTGFRGTSVAVYSLADGTEVASWDATSAVDYYVGSVQARVNPDGKTANIYVCGHKDCFGILKFYPGSSVKSIANEGLSYGKGSSALDEIVTEENTDVEYYNLQGVRVINPEKGIYIKRQGGKTSKVVL